MRVPSETIRPSRAHVIGIAAALLILLPTASGLLRGDIRLGLDPFALPNLIADLFVILGAVVVLLGAGEDGARGSGERSAVTRARPALVNLALVVVFLTLAGALPKVLGHHSDAPQVLGHYDADYLVFVAGYVALVIGAGAASGWTLSKTLVGDSHWMRLLRPFWQNPLAVGLFVAALAAVRFALPFVNRYFVAGRYLEAEVRLIVVVLGVTALALYEPPAGEGSGERARRRFRWIEGAIVALLCAFALYRWANALLLSEDSTIYLTTALNFVRTGRLFYYLNWPSFSLAPGIEPLTEWPPGFPLYLVPFAWLFDSPITAALIAYGLAIALFYGVAYALTRALAFPIDLSVLFFLLLTLLAPYVLILRHLWSETLFTAVSLGVVLCSVQLIRRPRGLTWAIALLLAFAGTWIRHIGIFNFAFLLAPAWLAGKQTRAGWAAAAFAASTAPMGIWLLRNRMLFGATDQVHGIGAMIYRANLLTPFTFLIHLFTLPGLVVFAAVLILPSLARRRESPAWWAQTSLVLGTFVHFAGLYAISLIAVIGALTDRMMSPVLTFGLLAAFNGLNMLSRPADRPCRAGGGRLNVALIALFGAIVLSPPPTGNTVPPGRADYSNIAALWGELHGMDVVRSASHFYTYGEGNTIHQVFAGMPQRELRAQDVDRLATRPDFLLDLLATGEHPFFLAKEGSDLVVALEAQAGPAGLDKIVFPDLGYVLYHASD